MKFFFELFTLNSRIFSTNQVPYYGNIKNTMAMFLFLIALVFSGCSGSGNSAQDIIADTNQTEIYTSETSIYETVVDTNETSTEETVVDTNETTTDDTYTPTSSNRAPIITSDSKVIVNENQTSALNIIATDPDGNTLTYALSGVDEGSFNINSSTGVISFIVVPDYETKTAYIFTITVSDGSLSTVQNILINISDIVETPILEDFIGFIDEDAAIGTVVGSITISDVGVGSISSFTLSDSTNFEINTRGSIRSKVKFDYETISVYNLTVFATNAQGDSASVDVTISINNIGDFYIRSAVYNNNATETVIDDILYIYFDQSINSASIASDMSINYTLEGEGVINIGAISAYDDAIFHQHIISLNNYDSAPKALVANNTSLSIASKVLQDTSGAYTIYDANKTTVEAFRPVLKTGRVISYTPYDDGAYQAGKTRSYTRDVATEIVTDNATGLMWQDDNNTIATAIDWESANSYCTSLVKGTFSDWRLPSLHELAQLADKKTSTFKSRYAIDPIFSYLQAREYWTTTPLVISTSPFAWYVQFSTGVQNYQLKTVLSHVRCVRFNLF